MREREPSRTAFAAAIPEQVTSDDHVERLRRAHQMHGSVVDVHVRELHVAIFAGHLDHRVAPELRGLQHIGLVDAAQALAALLRGAKGDMGHADDFRRAVAHGCQTLRRDSGTVRRARNACRAARRNTRRRSDRG